MSTCLGGRGKVHMHQAKAVGVSILRHQPFRRNQKQQQARQTMRAQIIGSATWVLLGISICCRLLLRTAHSKLSIRLQ